MAMNPFKINKNMKPRVHWLGDREAPLLLIDELYDAPDLIRQLAFEGEFGIPGSYYPGKHQQVDLTGSNVREFCDFIADFVAHFTKMRVSGNDIETDFSVITTPENQLKHIQGQPHIDGTPFLGVIYLNPTDMGGTMFFRNRHTGSVMVMSEKEKAHYSALTERKMASDERKSYLLDSNAEWEKIDTIPGQYNRLTIWPGQVFHSVEIKSNPGKGEIEEKRLTQRVIINRIS